MFIRSLSLIAGIKFKVYSLESIDAGYRDIFVHYSRIYLQIVFKNNRIEMELSFKEQYEIVVRTSK